MSWWRTLKEASLLVTRPFFWPFHAAQYPGTWHGSRPVQYLILNERIASLREVVGVVSWQQQRIILCYVRLRSPRCNTGRCPQTRND